MKIARIVYQLCDYTDFRVDFLQTRICGKWLVFANQVTYVVLFLTSNFEHPCIWSTHSRDVPSFHSIKCTVLWTNGTFALHSRVLFYSFMSANHHRRFCVTQLQVLHSIVCPCFMMRRWRGGNSGPIPNLVGRWVWESVLHTTHIPYFNASLNESHTNNETKAS